MTYPEYNPEKGTVSNRTLAQISRAKGKAVGGGRKKCIKGKSCSATCIAANKVCLVDIPLSSAIEIPKIRKMIQEATKPPVQPSVRPTTKTPTKVSEQDIVKNTMLAKYHANAYEEFAKKKKQTPQVLERLKYHETKADEYLNKLPNGEGKDKVRNFLDARLKRANVVNDRKEANGHINDAAFWHGMGQPDKGAAGEKNAKAAINKLPEGERVAALKKLDDQVKEAKQRYSAGEAEKKKLKERPPEEIQKVVDKYVKEMEGHYAKIVDLKKQNLPSGELKWRVEEAESMAKVARDRAASEANWLPSSLKGKAFDLIKGKEVAAKSPVMTSKEREKEVKSILSKYMYAKMAKDPEKMSDLRTQARNIAEGFTGAKKASMLALLDKTFGELKPLNFGQRAESYSEVAKVGQAMIDKYPRIKSAASILRKYEKLQETITERLKDPNLTNEQKGKLAEQLFRVTTFKNTANGKLMQAMESLRGDMLKTPLTTAQVNQALARVEFVKGAGIVAVRKDVAEFIKMFNGRGITDVENVAQKPLQTVKMTKTRAGANVLGKVTTSGGKVTTFHEITHVMEGQRQWMFDYAANWMRGKAFSESEAKAKGVHWGDKKMDVPVARVEGGKPLYQLLQIAGGGYKSDEVAYVDTYMSPYMGKVYSGQYAKSSSEVWSMALQQFASPDHMVKLYRQHPELFEVGVGLAGS
jgi:hypothetical protein